MLTGRAVYRPHILSALVHVLLAALSLRVFTLVLLRQGVPRPAALAFWLVATGLTVLWAVWMARRAPATRVGLFPILRKVNAPAVVLLAFLLLLIWMFHQGYGRAASDGRSYFVQVRFLVIDQDFDLKEEIASFRARDAARIYPVGTAILWIPFYTAGWSERERDPGQSFRWAVATESSLVVRLRERGRYRLQFRAEPFRYDGAPQPRVTIIVNGEAVAELELDAGWSEYQVDIPESNLGRTLTEIQFRYEYATSPLELGISGDPRPLAVRFDYVRVRVIE